MRLNARISGPAANNRTVRACFRLLTLVGFAHTAIGWYLSDGNDRPDLPDYERVIGMGIALGYCAEAAALFNDLRGRIHPSENWDQEALGAWEFLHSADADSATARLLSIRNQGIFHVDDAVVLDFLLEAARSKRQVNLGHVSEDGSRFTHLLAVDLLHVWLVKNEAHNDAQAELFMRILHSINITGLRALKDLVPVTLS